MSLIRQKFNRRYLEPVSRYFVGVALGFAMYVALAQFSTRMPLHGSAGQLAYLAFPLFVFSIFLAVYARSYALMRESWKNRRRKRISLLAGLGYVIFYFFATNAISLSNINARLAPRALHEYVMLNRVGIYGPLTVWPDVEFYSPTLNVSGYLSVGNLLLIVSMASLMIFTVSLLQYVNARTKVDKKSVSSFVGGLTALSTNVVTAASIGTCCGPATLFVPVLGIIFGSMGSSFLGRYFFDPTSPAYSLLVIIGIVLLFVTVLLATRRSRECGSKTCIKGIRKEV